MEKDCDLQIKIRESIYKRPGMYFGSTKEKGVEQFIYELVANVVDRFLVNKATFVKVKIRESTIVVSDDSDGLPFDRVSEIEGISLATKFLTQVHFSASQDEHTPHIHLIGNVMGLACLNIASSYCKVQSWRNGSLWSQEFIKGMPKNKPTIIDRGTDVGTTVEIIPNSEIFGNSKARLSTIRKALFEVAHLFGGLKVYFQEECFFAPDGLKMLGSILFDYEALNQKIGTPFHIKIKHKDTFIEAAAFANNHSSVKILSWVNGRRTYDNGSHVDGFRSALELIGWNPQLLLIQIIMHDPAFAAPMKTKLDVPYIAEEVKKALINPLTKCYSNRE